MLRRPNNVNFSAANDPCGDFDGYIGCKPAPTKCPMWVLLGGSSVVSKCLNFSPSHIQG